MQKRNGTPEKASCDRESVVGAMQRGEPRARMAIANEIGHFAMRHAGVRTRSTTQATAGRGLLEAKKEASEARRFAAMFLAPTISSVRLIPLRILWTVLD